MADGDDTPNGPAAGDADETTGPVSDDRAATPSTAGSDSPPTLASIAREAARRHEQGAAQPPGSPPAPSRDASSPPPPAPAPTRRGPIAQPGSRSAPRPPQPAAPSPARAPSETSAPSMTPSPGSPTGSPPPSPAEPPAMQPPAMRPGSTGSSLPGPAGAPSDGLGRPGPSANPPPAPPPPYERPDLSDILDRLHDDLDLEELPAPEEAGAALTDPRDLERPTDRNEVIIESEGGIDFHPTFASFAARLLGLVVDLAVIGVALAPGIVLALVGGNGAAVGLGVLVGIVGFAVVTVWYARSVARTGQWIGNRVTGTRVVDSRTGRNIEAGRAGTRFVVRQTVSFVFLMGFFYALVDGERRALHDRWADSVVVTRSRETWSVDDESPTATI